MQKVTILAIGICFCCLVFIGCSPAMHKTLDLLVYERKPTFRYAINEELVEGVYYVTEVLDGITLKLKDKRRTQLIGLELPQDRMDICKEAEVLIRSLAGKKHVIFFNDQKRTDASGTMLVYAYVYEDNTKIFLNELLVKEGLVRVTIKPPNDEKEVVLLSAQKEARMKRKGIWSDISSEPGDEEVQTMEQGLSLKHCIVYALDHSDDIKDARANLNLSRRQFIDSLLDLVPFPDLSAELSRQNQTDNPNQRTVEREGTISTSVSDTFWPGTSISGSANLSGENTRDTSAETTKEYGYSANLTVRQPFLRDLLDFSKIREKEAWDSARRSFIKARESIILNVVSAYFNLIRLGEDINTAKNSLARNTLTLKKTRAEFSRGAKTDIDVTEAENQLRDSLDKIKDIENELIERRRAFNDLVGFPKDQSTSLSTELIEEPIHINIEELIETAMQERLDLIDRRESYKRSQENHFKAKMNMLPELDWYLTYSIDESDSDSSDLFEDSGRPSWATGIEMSWSFDRLPLRNSLYSAEENLRKTKRSLRDFEEKIVEDLEDFKRKVEKNERDIALSKQEWKIREKKFLLEQADYDLGKIDLVELNRREEELTNLRRSYYRNLEQQQTLRFQLEQLKGILGKESWIERYLADE